MKSEMLRRVIRAIAEGSQTDLDRLGARIVDEERRTGHSKLADELQSILTKPRDRKIVPFSKTDLDRSMKELPLSKRNGNPLAALIPRDALEHHMVLPPRIEDRFARIEREYAARERLLSFGLRPRKTILLYGPPGCGKSLGAKRLAWNTGLPLIKVQFDALISSYFGESAINLRSVFDAASARSCVLLLDECDFIAKSRTNQRDIGEVSRIVNSLLQLMEDYDAPGLLVATTNIESSLDPAIFRRFDEVFQVPPPGPAEIEQLLLMTLSAIRRDHAINWSKIVAALAGASAALAVKSAQDAAKAAVLDGQKIVREDHLLNAISELKRLDRDAQND